MIVPISLLLAQSFGGGDIRRSLAAGASTACMMLPPETVCGAQAQDLRWTADGSCLLVQRIVSDPSVDVLSMLGAGRAKAPVPPRTDLVVWNVKAHRASVAMSMTAEQGEFDTAETMPGTDRVLIHYHQSVRGADGAPGHFLDGYSMLSASTGTVVRLSSNLDGDTTTESISVSPSRPLAALRTLHPNRMATVRFFGSDGRLGTPIELPQKAHILFDATGRPGYVSSVERKDGKAILKLRMIDPVSGKEGALVEEALKADETASAPDVQVQTVSGTVPTNGLAPGILLRLKDAKPQESGIVSTDGVGGTLSPKGDAVAYVSQGSAMIRQITAIPRSVYDAALIAAQKLAAISNAKQGALALILYASDMDDAFPSQNVDIRSKVGPYVLNDAILSSFNYTFGGGDLKSIKDPSSTEIGYVSGPGGRAVAYADGHVKWIPDAP